MSLTLGGGDEFKTRMGHTARLNQNNNSLPPHTHIREKVN